MKLDRKIWIRAEAKGFPDQELLSQGTVKELILQQAHWMAKQTLNTRFVITFAKTRDEVLLKPRNSLADDNDSFMSILDRIADGGISDESEG